MTSSKVGWSRVWRRCAGGVAGCALLAGIVAGCTTARNNLGTSDNSCYLALPTATRAVHGNGRLLGVERYTLTALRRLAPNLFEDLPTTQVASQQVCVIAFEGQFDTASVSDPHGRSSGRLAVVVSTAPANRLLGTVILRHLPLQFGHFHFG